MTIATKTHIDLSNKIIHIPELAIYESNGKPCDVHDIFIANTPVEPAIFTNIREAQEYITMFGDDELNEPDPLPSLNPTFKTALICAVCVVSFYALTRLF